MKTDIKILWLEEDPLGFIESAIKKNYSLIRAFKLSEAVNYLDEFDDIDVLLLDIMIPIYNKDKNYNFTDETTKRGLQSGLAFFKMYKPILDKKKIKVIVYSILGDDNGMKENFVQLGLDEKSYLDKILNSDIEVLLKNINRIINE